MLAEFYKVFFMVVMMIMMCVCVYLCVVHVFGDACHSTHVRCSEDNSDYFYGGRWDWTQVSKLGGLDFFDTEPQVVQAGIELDVAEDDLELRILPLS